MRPIKASSSLPGDPFLPNRFIFGDAVDENGLEEFEYMVHTEHPAFICRILPQDLDFRGSGGEGFRSACCSTKRKTSATTPVTTG